MQVARSRRRNCNSGSRHLARAVELVVGNGRFRHLHFGQRGGLGAGHLQTPTAAPAERPLRHAGSCAFVALGAVSCCFMNMPSMDLELLKSTKDDSPPGQKFGPVWPAVVPFSMPRRSLDGEKAAAVARRRPSTPRWGAGDPEARLEAILEHRSAAVGHLKRGEMMKRGKSNWRQSPGRLGSA